MEAIHASFGVANTPLSVIVSAAAAQTPHSKLEQIQEDWTDLKMLGMRSTICTQKESGTGAGSCIQNRLPVFLPFENGQAESMRPQTTLATDKSTVGSARL